jgi:hypothetical protein
MGTGMSAETDLLRITERLFYEVRNTRHDQLFTAASAADLFLKIVEGAATMVEQRRTTENDLDEALANLDRVLAEMDTVKASDGLSAFEEATVSAAFIRLCPGFFPFC